MCSKLSVPRMKRIGRTSETESRASGDFTRFIRSDDELAVSSGADATAVCFMELCAAESDAVRTA